jgi:GT2 family glycosyltransferase
MHPSVSVVIPVYNGADHLDRCLGVLRLSHEAPLECVVVDDGSTDESIKIADQYGAKVLSTGGRCGPAKARNIGAAAAGGSILLFIDSDITVRPDTLSRIIAEFDADAELDAVMGSYDDEPAAPNFVSQYRNLMHCFVHQHSNRRATTFWAGCGAIRRDVFLEFGGFDENYRSAAIEDIELGYRLSKAGRKLSLSPDIQVKHLKQWSLRSMMKADFLYRALPWAELTIRSGCMPNDLNLRISQRISVCLMFVLGPLAVYLALLHGALFLLPLLVTFFILLSCYWLDTPKSHLRLITSLMVTVLAAIAGLAYLSHLVVIFPMVLLSWIALFTRHRYLRRQGLWHRVTGAVVGGYCMLVVGFVWFYLPSHPVRTAFLISLLLVVALNQQFYFFLAGQKGRMFALAAIPFHLLYFISGGLAFMLALVRYRPGKVRSPAALPDENAKSRAAAAR